MKEVVTFMLKSLLSTLWGGQMGHINVMVKNKITIFLPTKEPQPFSAYPVTLLTCYQSLQLI